MSTSMWTERSSTSNSPEYGAGPLKGLSSPSCPKIGAGIVHKYMTEEEPSRHFGGNMDIIAAAIQGTIESEGVEHLARPAGSSVVGLDTTDGLAVSKWLEALDWLDVTDEAGELGIRFGNCRYFRARIPPGFEGQENVVLLEELMDHELEHVRVARGHHGNLELQLQGMQPRTTDVVHIILGNGDDFPGGEVLLQTAIVVTWYPGRFTKAMNLDGTTVKGVK